MMHVLKNAKSFVQSTLMPNLRREMHAIEVCMPNMIINTKQPDK